MEKTNIDQLKTANEELRSVFQSMIDANNENNFK